MPAHVLDRGRGRVRAQCAAGADVDPHLGRLTGDGGSQDVRSIESHLRDIGDEIEP
jgi:hypothetical protein